MFGTIVSVTSTLAGTETLADVAAGGTVLPVVSVGWLSDSGGTLTIRETGGSLTYLSVDADAGTVTLSAGLAADLAAGSLLDVSPAVTTVTAAVVLDAAGEDVGESGPALAIVPHYLRPLLADGVRGDMGTAERVRVSRQGWTLVVMDVLGLTPPKLADLEVGVAARSSVYYQETEPVELADIGDLWFRKSDNAIFQWDGVAWTQRLIPADQILTAGSITATSGVIASLDAGVITSGEVSANLVLAGAIDILDADGDVATSLNPDGSKFTGEVQATQVVADTLKVTGTMDAGSGSTLTLASAITAPGGTPTVTNTWTSIQLKNAAGASQPVTNLCQDGSGYWYSVIGSELVKFNSGGTYHSAQALTLDHPTDCTVVGGKTFVLFNDDWRDYGIDRHVDFDIQEIGGAGLNIDPVLNADGWDCEVTIDTVTRWFPSGTIKYHGYAVRLGNDGTNVVVAYVSATGYETFKAYSPTTGALVYTKTNSTKWTTTGEKDLWCAASGNFDLGAQYFITGIAGTGLFRYTKYSDQTNQPNNEFAQAATNTVAVGYDASGFWSASDAGKIYRHDGVSWVDAGSTKAHQFGYTFYDSNATGGTHETELGPKGTVSVKKRARLAVSVPSWTAGAAPDGVDRVRIYGGVSGGTLTLQATLTGKSTTLTAIDTGSAAAPTSNTFPAGSPAKIQSAAGALSMSGDGIFHWPTLAGDAFAPLVTGAQTASVTVAYQSFPAVAYTTSIFITAQVSGTLSADGDWRLYLGYDTTDPTSTSTANPANSLQMAHFPPPNAGGKSSVQVGARVNVAANTAIWVRTLAYRVAGTLTIDDGYGANIHAIQIPR